MTSTPREGGSPELVCPLVRARLRRHTGVRDRRVNAGRRPGADCRYGRRRAARAGSLAPRRREGALTGSEPSCAGSPMRSASFAWWDTGFRMMSAPDCLRRRSASSPGRLPTSRRSRCCAARTSAATPGPAARTLEAGVILVGVVAILPVVARPATGAGSGLTADVASGLHLVHDWTFLVGPGLINRSMPWFWPRCCGAGAWCHEPSPCSG